MVELSIIKSTIKHSNLRCVNYKLCHQLLRHAEMETSMKNQRFFIRLMLCKQLKLLAQSLRVVARMKD